MQLTPDIAPDGRCAMMEECQTKLSNPPFGRCPWTSGDSSECLLRGWKDEAAEFTPWLAENFGRLGETLGLALEHRKTEHPVGRYWLDILAEDARARRCC